MFNLLPSNLQISDFTIVNDETRTIEVLPNLFMSLVESGTTQYGSRAFQIVMEYGDQYVVSDETFDLYRGTKMIEQSINWESWLLSVGYIKFSSFDQWVLEQFWSNPNQIAWESDTDEDFIYSAHKLADAGLITRFSLGSIDNAFWFEIEL